ncbi:unnamed protein product [Cyclocybe aegerita]|uniref:Peptidase C14 caspase domain-containing protein n=1 Tax=Cyclocybe aegerita TaxID=1973307 RepID=A0A8S0VXS8_CYCAE|nr:unnamed protein product [Cyclocybe aegerita]
MLSDVSRFLCCLSIGNRFSRRPSDEPLTPTPPPAPPPEAHNESVVSSGSDTTSRARFAPRRTRRQRPPPPINPRRPPCKKALLIGISRVAELQEAPANMPIPRSWSMHQRSFGALQGPHNEVEATKNLLVDLYEYDPKDIVILKDSEGQSDELLPTRDNIIKRVKELTAEAKADDHFYFHFSGHSIQLPTTDTREEDRMNECIVTCDGYYIVDDDIREYLVEPIPEGAYLTVGIRLLLSRQCNRLTWIRLWSTPATPVHFWVMLLVARVIGNGRLSVDRSLPLAL